jgi:hypothetical protein
MEEEFEYELTICKVCGHDMKDPEIQYRNYIDSYGEQFCGWECFEIGSKEYEMENKRKI